MVPPALLATLPQTAGPGSPTAPPMPADAPAVGTGTSLLPLDADPMLGAALILLLCLVAGIGTVLLLPGRYGVNWRRAGGTIALVAGAALFVALFSQASDRPVVYFWIFSAIALVGSLRVVTHPKPVYSALYFVLTVFASAGLFVLLWAEFMAVALVVIYAGAILVTYTFVIMLAADAAPPSAGGSPEEAAKDFLAEHDRRARAPWSAAAVGFLTMAVLLFVILDRAPRTLEPRQSLTDASFLAPPPMLEESRDALGRDAEAGLTGDAGRVSTEAQPAPANAAASDLGPRGDLYPANEQPSYANERGGIQALGVYLFTRQIVSLQLAGLILTVAMVGAIVIARKQIIPTLGGVGTTTHDHGGDTYTTPFTPANDDPKSLPVVGTGDPRQKAYPQN